MNNEFCKCGHEEDKHILYGQPSGCIVGLLSLYPCPCRHFRPTKRELDVCPQCRETIKPYADMAGNKFCPSCGKRHTAQAEQHDFFTEAK